MIPIKTGQQPALLVKHKNTTVPDDPTYKPTYDNLSTEARIELKQRLLEDQGYICAYCMRKIDENSMSIEHFCSESRYNGKIDGYADLSLDYRNLLAVCENNGEHCDKYRSSQTEKIAVGDKYKSAQKEFLYLPNPKDLQQHNIRFSYSKNSFCISCNDKTVEAEIIATDNQSITNLLNLNCQTLVNNRKNAWQSVVRQLESKKNKNMKDWLQSDAVIRKAQQIYNTFKPKNQGKNEAYCGFICFMLKKVFGNKIT